MKKYALPILMFTAALAMGMAYHYRYAFPQRQAEEETAPLQAQVVNEPQRDGRVAIPPTPKPLTKIPEPKAPLKIASPQTKEQPQTVTADPRRATQYWRLAAQRFEQKMEQLDQENDPTRRMSLIRSMARNVRIDTPNTLDWAMNIENPEEQRAALEAINQNALVGIGAWLNVDETGLPQIMDTTVLSALADTGMTEPGDYISGMVNEDGSITYFQGLPLREIVQLLHGQPGTEVNLILERAPADDGSESYSFDVPVQRSMIIMQPRFE